MALWVHFGQTSDAMQEGRKKEGKKEKCFLIKSEVTVLFLGPPSPRV